jgi:hypothetical protein
LTYDELNVAVESAQFDLDLMYSDLTNLLETSSLNKANLATAETNFQKSLENLTFLKNPASVVLMDQYSASRITYDSAQAAKIEALAQYEATAIEISRIKKNIAEAEKALQALKLALWSAPKADAITAKILEFPYGKRRRDAKPNQDGK